MEILVSVLVGQEAPLMGQFFMPREKKVGKDGPRPEGRGFRATLRHKKGGQKLSGEERTPPQPPLLAPMFAHTFRVFWRRQRANSSRYFGGLGEGWFPSPAVFFGGRWPRSKKSFPDVGDAPPVFSFFRLGCKSLQHSLAFSSRGEGPGQLLTVRAFFEFCLNFLNCLCGQDRRGFEWGRERAPCSFV